MPKLPGGPSIHVDTFARDHLPPAVQWPAMDYGVLPELAAYNDRMNTSVALLDRQIAAGRGNHPAMLFDGGAWSYAEFRDQVDRIAHVLVDDMGLVPGNRVLLRGPNNPMVAAAWLATAK
ncbi:MAG: acyl-CoA synthetase, partial [bacterium]|nr:acyl-CoA synthetase [bacterium]